MKCNNGNVVSTNCRGELIKKAVPALFGFSATQAMVMPPISESLKRNRKVPLGLDISMSWACCLFTKPRIALRYTQRQKSYVYCTVFQWKNQISSVLHGFNVYSLYQHNPSVAMAKNRSKIPLLKDSSKESN